MVKMNEITFEIPVGGDEGIYAANVVRIFIMSRVPCFAISRVAYHSIKPEFLPIHLFPQIAMNLSQVPLNYEFFENHWRRPLRILIQGPGTFTTDDIIVSNNHLLEAYRRGTNPFPKKCDIIHLSAKQHLTATLFITKGIAGSLTEDDTHLAGNKFPPDVTGENQPIYSNISSARYIPDRDKTTFTFETTGSRTAQNVLDYAKKHLPSDFFSSI